MYAPTLLALVLTGTACAPHSSTAVRGEGRAGTGKTRSPDRNVRRVEIEFREGAAHFRLRFSEPPGEPLVARVRSWIARSARSVTDYYGVFPFDAVRVELTLGDGALLGRARVFGGEVPTIRADVGRETPSSRFEADWRMTHEMVHLAFPDVDRRHHWIEEGLATYVEPIARARIGWLDERDVYREWLTDMHQGQPVAGDGGLDGTTSWARTYWGGALFCLKADAEIRARTNGERGLRDALRAILREGGRMDVHWPLSHALEIGDEATGVSVLQELYARMGTQPVAVDLTALWAQLGISDAGDRVVLDEGRERFRRAFIFD